MTKDIYESKLLLLKMQIDNMMLMEGEEDVAASGLPVGGATVGGSEFLSVMWTNIKWFIFNPLSNTVAAAKTVKKMISAFMKTGSLKKACTLGFRLMKKFPAVQTAIKGTGWFKTAGAAIATGAKGVASLAAGAPIAAAVIIGSLILGSGTLWYRSGTLDRVKEATAKALSNGNISDLSKHVNTLKKISGQGFWNSLINQKEGRDLAASNIEGIRKGYITVGIGLILISVLSIVILSNNMDVIGPLTESVKKLDLKGIASALGELLTFGFAALPAILGVCFIVVAKNCFINVEGSVAGKILTVFSPVVSFANKIILGTLQILNAKTMEEQQLHIKKLNYTKRRH